MSLVDKLAGLQVDAADLDRLRHAEDELRRNATDASSIKTKLVALIRLDKYEAAAQYLKTLSAPGQFPEEAAYIWYRTENLEKLRELAKSHSSRGVQLALAQAEYKAGNYFIAQDILSSTQAPADEKEDVAANLSAVTAHTDAPGSHPALSGFEQSFNTAYAYLRSGDITSALDSLRKAKADARDEEESHSAVIQAAYAHSLLGQADEAKTLLDTVDFNELDDLLKAIVSNNQLVFNPPTDPETAQEILKSYGIENTGLVAAQRELFSSNNIAIQALSGRKVGHVSNKHLAKFPANVAPQVVTSIRNTENDIRQIRKQVAREPTNAGASLALAQILSKEDVAKASAVVIDLVKALVAKGEPIRAGLVGAAIAAYKTRSANPTKAINELLNSVELRGDFAIPASILAQSSNSEDREKAAAFFKGLANDVLSGAGILSAIPDANNYEAISQKLPSVADLTADVDVPALEELGILPLIKRKARGTVGPKKSKRSGKPKLPADYDANKTPNPERWLAKEDRSDYKPKRGKKGGQAQGATQGAAQGSTQPEQKPASTVVTAGVNKAKAKKKKGKKK